MMATETCAEVSMEGLLWLSSIIGVYQVIYWVIRNDAVGPGEETTGIFKME